MHYLCGVKCLGNIICESQLTVSVDECILLELSEFWLRFNIVFGERILGNLYKTFRLAREICFLYYLHKSKLKCMHLLFKINFICIDYGFFSFASFIRGSFGLFLANSCNIYLIFLYLLFAFWNILDIKSTIGIENSKNLILHTLNIRLILIFLKFKLIFLSILILTIRFFLMSGIKCIL